MGKKLNHISYYFLEWPNHDFIWYFSTNKSPKGEKKIPNCATETNNEKKQLLQEYSTALLVHELKNNNRNDN